MRKHIIVTLIGSTALQWQEQYRKVNRELALQGFCVLSVSMFKTDVKDIEQHRDLLESIHFQKIDMADVIVLIHGNAVGKHTQMEINYCTSTQKPVITYVNSTFTANFIQQMIKEMRNIKGEHK